MDDKKNIHSIDINLLNMFGTVGNFANMLLLRILLFAILSLLYSGAVSAGEADSTACVQAVDLSAGAKNPLLDLIGKPYGEYHDTYMYMMSNLLHGDSLARVRLMALFDEAAAVDKSGEWKLVSGIVANTVRFYNSRRGGFISSPDYTAEDFSADMLALAGRAGKQGFPLIRLFALYQAAEGFRYFVEDYEQAFACYLEAAAGLETVTTREFPPRPHIYNQIGNLYYNFREYGDAIEYYSKVTADPDVADNYYHSRNLAINGMALSYRNGYEDYNRSDSCFRQLLALTEPYEPDRVVWEGITEANIGYNYYLKKQPDVALAWLVPALGKITRPNDYEFVSQRAADVAGIYLDKGETAAAKKYIDMALDYHDRTRLPEKGSHLYDVFTRYYTATGSRKMASAYLDSTLTAKDKEAEAFSGLVLRRVEQQLRAADQKLHKQQIDAEQAHSRVYLHAMILTATALAVILVLLGLTFFFYHRTRTAYRELVRRTQLWAGVEVPVAESPAPEESQPDEMEENVPDVPCTTTSVVDSTTDNQFDELIMAEIIKSMTEKKIYKRAELTLDLLAGETGFNRYYLSGVLNRCTGRNFNTYVNEYRVKEAIRIMSEPDSDSFTMDHIAFEAGFNDRQALYRVFRKITGISPGDFRRNRPVS